MLNRGKKIEQSRRQEHLKNQVKWDVFRGKRKVAIKLFVTARSRSHYARKILTYEKLIVFIKNLAAVFKDKVCLVKIYRFACAAFWKFMASRKCPDVATLHNRHIKFAVTF